MRMKDDSEYLEEQEFGRAIKEDTKDMFFRGGLQIVPWVLEEKTVQERLLE